MNYLVLANLCHPNPCLNSGQCMDIGGTYDCVCTPQYKGKHCEGKKSIKFQDLCDIYFSILIEVRIRITKYFLLKLISIRVRILS